MTDLLLPEGTRLLHIGPPKTGTTSLQYALARARPLLGSYGVVYPGDWRQHGRAARAIRAAEKGNVSPGPMAAMAHWDTLVQQVAAVPADQRVVMSAEIFSSLGLAWAREVVQGLGGPRVHVLVTLRPLSKIMPSAWQQYVRSGLTTPYDEWLECMFKRPPYLEPTPAFWAKHRHEVLIDRWASIVGPQNLTAVVIDDRDRHFVTHAVELLVGLPHGLLDPHKGRSNRSMTLGEIELIRQLNIEFVRNGWPRERYETFIQTGLNYHLQEKRTPSADEPSLRTPDWAYAAAAETGRVSAERISALGVRVIGDLASLGSRPAASPDGGPGEARLPVAAAATAVVGLTAAIVSDKPNTHSDPISGRRLLGVAASRVRRRAARAVQGRTRDKRPREAALPALLPSGAHLLHIGPHKTGTTAVQGALQQSREDMQRYGVLYPGRGRQHWQAALAVAGGRGLKGQRRPLATDWDDLVHEVAAAPADQRVIISSEAFCSADNDTAGMIVDQLGGRSVHVLVTLRPLGRILPSAWQQYVRNGLAASYERWLKGMLQVPPYDRPTPTFWRRHRHDVLVERWASIVGRDNVTVVVLDEKNALMPMEAIEDLVGLPRGLLQPKPGRMNRSLTLAEIELIREINRKFKARKWPDDLYHDLIGVGMIEQMQHSYQPAPGEARLITPSWALDRATEIGAEIAEKIGTCGVRIIGDIGSLGAPQRSTGQVGEVPTLPVEAVTAALTGTVIAGLDRLGDLTDHVESMPTREVLAAAMSAARGRLAPGDKSRRPGPLAGSTEGLRHDG